MREIQLDLFAQQFKELEKREELTFQTHNNMNGYRYMAVIIEGNLGTDHPSFPKIMEILPVIGSIAYLVGYTTKKYGKMQEAEWLHRSQYLPVFIPYGERSPQELYEVYLKFKSGSERLISRLRGIVLPGESLLEKKLDIFETLLEEIRLTFTYGLS